MLPLANGDNQVDLEGRECQEQGTMLGAQQCQEAKLCCTEVSALQTLSFEIPDKMA
jgi:hypothetical protein